MKGLFLGLMPLLLVTGCGTVVDVFKKTGQVWMDPSIQVGSNDDQPTQVALSLYAQADVNPNGRHEADTEDGPDKARDVALVKTDGPYALSFTSNSKSELIESLHELLTSLRDGADSSAGVGALALPGPAHSIDSVAPPMPLSEPVGNMALALPTVPERADTGTVVHDVNGGTPLGTGDELGQYQATGKRPSFRTASARARTAAPVGTPIAFKVLQLKDDSLLLNADPGQLRKNLERTLGNTYLAADDYLLAPGQFKFINFSAIRDDTRYLAVIADFHDANAEAWKQVISLEPKGRKYSLLITLSGTRVRIVDERMPTATLGKPSVMACVPDRSTGRSTNRSADSSADRSTASSHASMPTVSISQAIP